MRKSLSLSCLVLLLGTQLYAQQKSSPDALVVDMNPAHGRVFIPNEALGTLDRQSSARRSRQGIRSISRPRGSGSLSLKQPRWLALPQHKQ
jgi:hypothetical protein